MDPAKPILIASGDIESRQALEAILSEEGLDTITASRLEECKEVLVKNQVSMVFCDRRLTDGNYRDFLNLAKNMQFPVKVVVTSVHADWDEYLDVLRLGAFDLIAAPCRSTDVLWTLSQASRDVHTHVLPKEPVAMSAAAGGAI
jgi:DNA-binding NtrC family response regulator